MTDEAAKLPSYRHPPLVEVVFSTAFRPVEGITLAHLGRWWEILGTDAYPTSQEQPPLGQAIEHFGTNPPTPEVAVGPVPPAPRLWFLSAGGDHVVQVQRDRLLCNWRKTSDEHEYPRFGIVSGQFLQTLNEYAAFVRAETGSELDFSQFELTYINHLPGRSIAQAFGEPDGDFSDITWGGNERFLPAPSGLEARLSFDLPDSASRLHAKINTGRRRNDGVPVIILEMTARGLGTDLDAWFRQAHEWIVRGFTDLTSATAHERWGRTT